MPVGATENYVLTQKRVVTNLQPEGDGSLRDAIMTIKDTAGYEIEFAVAGVIDWSTKLNGASMSGDTQMLKPGIVVKGETAPGPLTVNGGTLVFANSNQEVRHMRFLPGDRDNGPSKNDRDAVRVGIQQPQAIENNILRHCTLAWALDETLSFWDKPYYTVRGFLAEECIFAEALKNAGHPEGSHSTGVLFGSGCRDILLRRCLLSSCSYRAPAIAYGVNAAVVNCVTYNFNHTYEWYAGTAGDVLAPSQIAFLGCETVVGPEKQNEAYATQYARAVAGSSAYYKDVLTSIAPAMLAAHPYLANVGSAYPADPIVAGTLNVDLPPYLDIMPAAYLRASLAGSIGPCIRTELESRLIAEMLDGTIGSIKDNIAALPMAEQVLYGFA